MGDEPWDREIMISLRIGLMGTEICMKWEKGHWKCKEKKLWKL